MPSYHDVEQGEYLSKIAARYGFSDYRTIWNHGENAALKAKRKNPNVLYPGDRLYIPDKEVRGESRSTDQTHKFKVNRNKLKLGLVLEDQYEHPIASAPCELHLDGQVYKLTTDGKGKLEQEIKPAAEGALLIIRDPQTSINEIVLSIKIGHLDPVEEDSGKAQRLNNLGYFAGPLPENGPEENRQLLRSAVEEFQCDHGLKVDGVCGSKTQAKLIEAHGS